MLIFWSDGVDSISGNLQPFRVSIANISNDYRLTDGGSRLLGMLGTLLIRSREGLRWDQHALKSQAVADGPALALALAELLASGPVEHRFQDGTINVYYRALIYACDIKEKNQVLAVRKTSCCRCLGLQHARACEDPFPYLNLDAAGFCATADKRTPATILANQARMARVARETGNKGKADRESLLLGIKYDVNSQLLRFESLFPHRAGGPHAAFAVDFLHVFGLGIVKVFLKLLDYLLCKEATRSPESQYKTKEDVRNEIEFRLVQIPTMTTPDFRLIPFKIGWWSEDLSKISSSDYCSFFSQLLFTYVADDVLIPNRALRRRLVRLHSRLFSVY